MPIGYYCGMRTMIQLQAALGKVDNIAEFARKHKLPQRTVWRVLKSGIARRGTQALIDAAITAEKDRS